MSVTPSRSLMSIPPSKRAVDWYDVCPSLFVYGHGGVSPPVLLTTAHTGSLTGATEQSASVVSWSSCSGPGLLPPIHLYTAMSPTLLLPPQLARTRMSPTSWDPLKLGFVPRVTSWRKNQKPSCASPLVSKRSAPK